MPQNLSSSFSICQLLSYCSFNCPLFLMKSIIRLKASGFRSIKTLSSSFCIAWRPENMASRALPCAWHRVDRRTLKSSLPLMFNLIISSSGCIFLIFSFSYSHAYRSFAICCHSLFRFDLSVSNCLIIASLHSTSELILFQMASLKVLTSCMISVHLSSTLLSATSNIIILLSSLFLINKIVN